jgi:hypothetical protein
LAKIYTSNTWVDEALADDPRFNILEDGGTPIYSDVQIAQSTDVVQAGTAADADLMNNIEDGIDALDTIIADQVLPTYTTGGTDTAFTLTTLAAIDLTTNERWKVKFNATAGATPTLNRDGKGAKSLKYYDSTGAKVACGATTIIANMLSDVEYDGTDYVVLDKLPIVLASSSEINTGTDAVKAISPDALAGSNLGIRIFQIEVESPLINLTTGNGKKYFVLPSTLDGMNLVLCNAQVITVGTTNQTTVGIYNVTDSHNVLSANMGIDSGENGSNTGTVGTIDTDYDDVDSWDIWRIDVAAVSTTPPKGLIVTMGFAMP